MHLGVRVVRARVLYGGLFVWVCVCVCCYVDGRCDNVEWISNVHPPRFVPKT
jgi:hypothetical protein